MKNTSPSFILSLFFFCFFMISCKQNPSGAGRGGNPPPPSFFSCADKSKKIPKERFFLVDSGGIEDKGKHEFTEIGKALWAARDIPDSHVCVKPGTYKKSLNISNGKDITLECENIAGRSCLIEAETNDALAISFNIKKTL